MIHRVQQDNQLKELMLLTRVHFHLQHNKEPHNNHTIIKLKVAAGNNLLIHHYALPLLVNLIKTLTFLELKLKEVKPFRNQLLLLKKLKIDKLIHMREVMLLELTMLLQK